MFSKGWEKRPRSLNLAGFQVVVTPRRKRLFASLPFGYERHSRAGRRMGSGRREHHIGSDRHHRNSGVVRYAVGRDA